MQVTRLVARCDLVTRDEYLEDLQRYDDSDASAELEVFDRSASFSVEELAVLADGTEVLLSEAGWSSTPHGTTVEGLWEWLTVESVTENVLVVVQPDDDEPTEPHPDDLLAEELDGVTGDDLRAVPYDVELSGRLRSRLEGAAP